MVQSLAFFGKRKSENTKSIASLLLNGAQSRVKVTSGQPDQLKYLEFITNSNSRCIVLLKFICQPLISLPCLQFKLPASFF